MLDREGQSGQVLVIVAVWLVALIGSAALILLTGSVEWQRNQLQQITDQAALDAALKISVGCTAGSASTVITEADNFVATQRTRNGTLTIAAGSCAASYTGTDTFSSGITETIHYPYRSHQQQVEVILTEALPISFGSYLGATNTNVTRRAVAQQLNGSTAAVTATTLSCTGGQFNVAGSVVASNAISLSGSCAIYTHDRFDASSSTYSDLGNTSVYAGGQAWVGGGGSCTAGSTGGSSNALCADGYQVSGHNATTCGVGGTSAYLAAGDAAINPNPCAAGTGAQPVAPLSSLLPPEPNTDPAAIATLQGNGGAACTAGGVYPSIVAGGVTWGTGLAPAPVKDASGYWHFKPSCYGYLNFASLAAGIVNRQVGTEIAPASHFITPTLPAASQAGTLLVVTLAGQDGINSYAGPAGWVLAASAQQIGEGWNEVWYYPNNPGGITSATWTSLPASKEVVAQMTEWRGAATLAPLDQTGITDVGAATTTATVSTVAATSQANELVITSDGFKVAGGSFTPGAGWNSLVNDVSFGFGTEYRLDLPAAIASETVSSSQASLWSLAIAAFKPAPPTGGAVLDPGLYYFNGSGFAGGGGICLNGGTLLAQAVTLEFVNQAGFSSGSCAAGGGTACSSGSCQFGSTPCSISACPPNLAADLISGGYSWFAAPCAQAPAGDASCPASAWCVNGDRACTDVLIWAPTSNTGQIAIKGTFAKAWLLGSVFWPGTCTDMVNGSSTLDGTIACGTLTVSAATGVGTAIGSDFGISTALVEAVLVE
jgi:hypothetical protein